MNLEQAFSKVENLDRPKKGLIIFLALVVLCGAYWYFFYNPSTERIAELEQEIDNLDRQIANYRQQVERLPELRDRLEDQERILAHAQTLLPEDEHEVENLLAQIEQLGSEENVEFLSFSPGSEETQEQYVTRSLSLELEGSFHDLMQFFNRISNLETLITIESLNLNPQDPHTDGTISISSSSRIQIYRALEE